MAIIIDQEQKLITLHTKNTTYQMGVGNYGQLLHLYYGKRLTGDMRYLLIYYDRGIFPAIRMRRSATRHIPWMHCHKSIRVLETGISAVRRLCKKCGWELLCGSAVCFLEVCKGKLSDSGTSGCL